MREVNLDNTASYLLSLSITSCRNLGETQLVNVVKGNLMKGFRSFWHREKKSRNCVRVNLAHILVLRTNLVKSII